MEEDKGKINGTAEVIKEWRELEKMLNKLICIVRKTIPDG
jgi:hypothetical protein